MWAVAKRRWLPSAWITLPAITSKWRPSARCRCFLSESSPSEARQREAAYARIGAIQYSRRAAYVHYPQVDSHESEQLSGHWLLHRPTNAPTKTEGQLWPTNKTPILCKNLVRETQPRSRRAASP